MYQISQKLIGIIGIRPNAVLGWRHLFLVRSESDSMAV
jgi:hypothetical protein